MKEEIKDIYNEEFWGVNHGNYNYKSAKIILPILFNHYKPNSIIDVGCGIGTWLKAAKELGINKFVGIDGNEIEEDFLLVSRKYIKIDNLETHKNINNEKYDLAISVEVAEHLHNNCSVHFVKTLTSYSDVVLFSAAIPYQEGEHHINCNPPQFWVDIFKKYGYDCYDFRNDLMNMWEKVNPCYSQNILLFAKEKYRNTFMKFNLTEKPIFYYHPAYVDAIVNNKDPNVFNEIENLRLNCNWFNIFGISNNNEYLRITLFGIKFTFRVNENIINNLAWFIPIRKLRDGFREKFKMTKILTGQDRTGRLAGYLSLTNNYIINNILKIKNVKRHCNINCSVVFLFNYKGIL